MSLELERDHPGAAKSLREGLEEILTVKMNGLNHLAIQSQGTVFPCGPSFSFTRHPTPG